ncbi:hypothetical protein GINT2_000529 [Glugoides intestinalis]
MKVDVNKKLLKLVCTEVLLQLGFERSVEQALNVLTEIFSFYLEFLIQKVVPLLGCEDSTLLCKFLIENTYEDEQYQIRELFKFMEHQISLKALLVDKHNVDCDESLFYSLKLLPKGVSFRSVFRNTKTTTLEEKKSINITEDIAVDEFMNKFVDSCSSENSKRVLGTYAFDCSKIFEDINGNGLVPFERINLKPKDSICGYRDQYLAEQELFIEDFCGTERYEVPK